MKVHNNVSKKHNPNQPITPGICAIILNNKDQILLHKRSGDKKWTLPGGKMKVGESISDCCKREIQEELKLRVSIEKVTGIYTSPNNSIELDKS